MEGMATTTTTTTAVVAVQRRKVLPHPVAGDEFSMLGMLRQNVGKVRLAFLLLSSSPPPPPLRLLVFGRASSVSISTSSSSPNCIERKKSLA